MHVVERVLFDDHQICSPQASQVNGVCQQVAWYTCMCMMTDYCVYACQSRKPYPPTIIVQNVSWRERVWESAWNVIIINITCKIDCISQQMPLTQHTHTHTHTHTLIGVHKMHGRMHPNYCLITVLLVVDLFIIGLLYDDPTPSHSRQIAYKHFGLLGNYQQTHTHINNCVLSAPPVTKSIQSAECSMYSPHMHMQISWSRFSTCSCYGCQDLHIQHNIIVVLFLVFSTFVPQVKTVTCGVAIVTQPHATPVAKPLSLRLLC